MANLDGSVQLSQFPQLLNTRRERPSNESTSNAMLLQAGYIHVTAPGIVELSEMGLRSLNRVERIVREEMKKLASEVRLTALQPRELWERAGRWEKYGKAVFRTSVIDGSDMMLAPTHEEPITDYAKTFLHSHKQLPFSLYQITSKFRNELRPKGGLMRGREFLMKDSYSFDLDVGGMVQSFENHREAYRQIFSRLGLQFYEVQADSGAIGGSGSIEFLVKAEHVGEDILMLCTNHCGYGANLETAVSGTHFEDDVGTSSEVRKVHTPNVGTIDDLTAFLVDDLEKYSDPERMIKTLIYNVDDAPVVVILRGDYEVNEVKLRNALNANEVELADEDTIREVTGANVGFAGPFELSDKYTLVADPSVMVLRDALTGANETDYHYTGIDAKRDINATMVKDIRDVVVDEPCIECSNPLESVRGTEVGHIFQLGTAYSGPLGLTYLDDQQQAQEVVMGCYGIGVSRLLPVVLEQEEYTFTDGKQYGINWPDHLAPFDIMVIPTGRQEEVNDAARNLYHMFDDAGLDVLLDDREDSRFGVKMNDADLVGVPLKVIVSPKTIENQTVEIETRTGEKLTTPYAIISPILEGVNNLPWDQRVTYLKEALPNP
jgi:prolyl-tRNA synthetase